MRRKEHQQFNFLLGTLTGFARGLAEATDDTDFVELAFGALASGAGATLTASLPDAIDPPDHPGHRDVGHGVVPVGLACAGAFKLAQQVRDPIVRRFFEGAALGPVAHLAADATTPAGLNLVGRGF